MASKNKLLSKGGVVEQAQEQPKIETPLDLLPDVAYPTWMKHEKLGCMLANSKKEYYDLAALGYAASPVCCVNN